jgi:splicing factor U2AF subunit
MDMIRGVQMNESYAFVEFQNHSDAELAFSMDGITFDGLVLKVKPPKEMKSYYDTHPVRRYAIPGALSSSVENGPNKIFLGNLPRELPDDDVRRLCETIGPLSAFNIVKNSQDGSSKGYGFLTYRDPAHTHSALQFLNGQVFCGKVLSCSIAQDAAGGYTGGMPMPGMPMPMSMPMVSPNDPPAKRASAAHLAPVSEGGVTRVLVLHNLCSEQELREEYDDIVDDVRNECSGYGHVEEVVGKVDIMYVAFSTVEGAAQAAMRLTGRKFGDNYVGTSSMSEQEFYDTISRRQR